MREAKRVMREAHCPDVTLTNDRLAVTNFKTPITCGILVQGIPLNVYFIALRVESTKC